MSERGREREGRGEREGECVRVRGERERVSERGGECERETEKGKYG